VNAQAGGSGGAAREASGALERSGFAALPSEFATKRPSVESRRRAPRWISISRIRSSWSP
jgi:hypothetical protein